MGFDVLVLAGGEAPEGLGGFTDFNTKATLKLNNRLMIEYVVDALQAAPGVGRILIVGSVDPLEKVLAGRVWKVLPPKDKMLENLEIGLNTFAGSEWLLVSTCDIPLISGEMIGRYVEKCKGLDGDLFYPMISKQLNDEKYPATKRTYMKVKDGTFTGGNVVLMKPDALKKCWPTIDAAIAARKSPLKLLKIIGFGFIIKYIFHMLDIAEAESKIRKILGVNGRAIPVDDAELGIDVDKTSDFELVTSILGKK